MYYDKQDKVRQERYKKLLEIVGKISKINSDSDVPSLYYKTHENIFAKCFDVISCALKDNALDAYSLKESIGIGLKTFQGSNDQKVAEFNTLADTLKKYNGLDLANKVSEYRNSRISTTMNLYGLKDKIYHIVKRTPKMMHIYESAYDYIDIPNISLIPSKSSANNLYFTDNIHRYHFNRTKSTLYMLFDDMSLLDEFEVEIIDDPFTLLEKLLDEYKVTQFAINTKDNQLCLKLYSENNVKGKFVPAHSGLNQWNGARKKYKEINGKKVEVSAKVRNPNEIYIAYPKEDRDRKQFFPNQNESFELILPNGSSLSARICQQDGKAIMSNPNDALGKWLLRDVLQLEKGTLITYELLQIINIDSVIFTKLGDKKFSIDFCPVGTYDQFYNDININEKEDA